MSRPMELMAKDRENKSSQARGAELLRHNEVLRNELEQLRKQVADLDERLRSSTLSRYADRESRRAALNLMEDAVAARQAEQHENAERRRVEEELRAANRRKDEFLATLAHELRNPLAPIRNSLQILRLAGSDSGGADRVCEMLDRQVNHMIRLVDDLMEMSRITRGKIELRREPIELATIIRNAVETSKPILDAARHQLAISLPSMPLVLFADPVRMAQVVSNLLNNAAKYTPEGGQIWLTARRDDEQAVISVRDNGSGIPAEMLSNVFELFTQIDHTLGRAQGGLGIGLALVRNLVEMHGGTVEAQSGGLNQGSEFTIRLPLANEKQRSHTPDHGEEHAHSITPRRILVVDDNHDAADSLGTLLKFLGAEATVVYDGESALQMLPKFRPSVLLLDIGMPKMDGNEVARQVRQQPEGRDVTIIALTGWGQETDRRKSHDAGFDYHLVKPVDIAVLQDLLASLPAQRLRTGR